MAFPLTHLCVAYQILDKLPLLFPHSAELFILGSIAPDAVHHRNEFMGAPQSNIGPAKKITHLCPVGEEKWGYVTDNDGWVQCVQAFLYANPGNPFAAGYAVHVLTDIFNNLGIWRNYVKDHPDEAAKGYASGYYKDLRNIDLRLYNECFKNSEIEYLLQNATAQDMYGLVSCDEVQAIQYNLLNVAYVSAPTITDTSECFYVTYEQAMEAIEDGAEFCIGVISNIVNI